MREPYVEPPPEVKKTRGKKRDADVSDPLDSNTGSSKKMKTARSEAPNHRSHLAATLVRTLPPAKTSTTEPYEVT